MLLLRAHHPKTTVEECIVVLSGDGMVDLFQKGDLGIAAVPVETNVVKVECLYCAHRINCAQIEDVAGTQRHSVHAVVKPPHAPLIVTGWERIEY